MSNLIAGCDATAINSFILNLIFVVGFRHVFFFFFSLWFLFFRRNTRSITMVPSRNGLLCRHSYYYYYHYHNHYYYRCDYESPQITCYRASAVGFVFFFLPPFLPPSLGKFSIRNVHIHQLFTTASPLEHLLYAGIFSAKFSVRSSLIIFFPRLLLLLFFFFLTRHFHCRILFDVELRRNFSSEICALEKVEEEEEARRNKCLT